GRGDDDGERDRGPRPHPRLVRGSLAVPGRRGGDRAAGPGAHALSPHQRRRPRAGSATDRCAPVGRPTTAAAAASYRRGPRDGAAPSDRWRGPPLLSGADHETGQLHAMGDGATPFAGAMALGAVGDADLAERVAFAI